MKSSHLIMTVILLLAGHSTFSQKILKLSSLHHPERSITITENNRVTARYEDSTKKRGYTPWFYRGKNLHFVSGKVLSITDTSICINQPFRKPVTIKLNSIAQIRKDQLGYVMLFAGACGLVLGTVYIFVPIHPFLLAGGGTIVATTAGDLLVYPLKNLSSAYFGEKDLWKLEVVDQ